MNFYQLNTFTVLSGAALLSVLASFSSAVFAAPLDHNSSVSQHEHHSMHPTTRPMLMTNKGIDPASITNVPDVDNVEHSQHSEPAAHLAVLDKNQISTGLRNPDYSDGYRNKASHHMMSSPNFWSFDAEKLELTRPPQHSNRQNTSGQYELKFWYGNDYNRLYLNTSGEFEQDKLQQASTSAMWWRPFSAYWNTTFGLKQEYTADNNDQTWLGGGISGLAPYWFDVEAGIYASTQGNTQLELSASYDLNINQKWILQPEIELLAYGKTHAEHRYGAGLAQVNTGLRLRYEITPQLAPYIGFEHARVVGKTARFYKDREDDSRHSKILLGLRFWY
jgi:copper resistance protein B